MSKNGFESHGSTSATSGDSGSNDQPSPGGAASALRTPRSTSRIHDIIPFSLNQLLIATVVDSVFKVRGIEVSQVSIVGIIRKVERAAYYIVYKIDDMTTKPIDACHFLSRD